MPSATAGAVSRLAGSAKMFSGGSEVAISRTAACCRWLVRIRMFSGGTRPSRRAIVCSEQGGAFKQLEQLLGAVVAAQRPEAGARSAGEDQGVGG